MSIEMSEEYIITRRPNTRYYCEMIQKCLPPEIKWLEHFICIEFPQTFWYQSFVLHPKYDSKVSSGTLVSSYAVFIEGWRLSEPTNAQFGNKIIIWWIVKVCLLRKEGTNMDASPGYFRDVVCMIGWQKRNTRNTYWGTKTTSTVEWHLRWERSIRRKNVCCNITKDNYSHHKILFQFAVLS